MTSAAGTLIASVVLARLGWITDRRSIFREKQGGFRRHRCTADSLGDVLSMLEQPLHEAEVAFPLQLDMQSAFDSVPNSVVLLAIEAMDVTGNLRRYVRAFLADRNLLIKVGRATSSPPRRSIWSAQGSVLSPFLFNLVLAALADCIPAGLTLEVGISVYADDVALWTHGPNVYCASVRACIQEVMGEVAAFLTSRGLQLSETKMWALMGN